MKHTAILQTLQTMKKSFRCKSMYPSTKGAKCITLETVHSKCEYAFCIIMHKKEINNRLMITKQCFLRNKTTGSQ